MKVKELFELYEAAKAGKKIIKDCWRSGNYTNGYIDDNVDFLNEDIDVVLSGKTKDGMNVEYRVNE